MAVHQFINSSASEDRLEKLIKMRIEPGADRSKIDKRIWDLFGERWAVMFTDLCGFSRSVAEFGIIHFLQMIQESKRLLIPVIDEYDGILLKVEADSLMVIFRNPAKAVKAAIHMQAVLREYNVTTPDEDDILLCVGLGYGDMLRIGDHDVFGNEVNAASKLGEDIARAHEILVTDDLKHLIKSPQLSFEEIDEKPPGAERAWRMIYPGFAPLENC